MPIRLPSIDEVEGQVLQLDARQKQDPESAREQLRRWLIGVDQTPKMNLPETNPLVSGRYTVVAGAGFEPATFGL